MNPQPPKTTIEMSGTGPDGRRATLRFEAQNFQQANLECQRFLTMMGVQVMDGPIGTLKIVDPNDWMWDDTTGPTE